LLNQQRRQCARDLSNPGQCLLVKPNHDDAGRFVRRMLNDVCEPPIERDQDTALCGSHGQQPLVCHTSQLLISRKSHVVTERTEDRPYRVRDVLIELDAGHI
jgi:hypothetical protein